jgi:hypothetical protein
LSLLVPRRLNRSSWLRWVFENASELTRSPLRFNACELGVVVDQQSLDVIARSPLLFRACEIVASRLAGVQSPYIPVAIDAPSMECPSCGDGMALGDMGTEPSACPQCESQHTRSSRGHAPATFLVDYFPIDGKEIRRVFLHLKQLAEPSCDSESNENIAFEIPQDCGLLWDQELDGLELVTRSSLTGA